MNMSSASSLDPTPLLNVYGATKVTQNSVTLLVIYFSFLHTHTHSRHLLATSLMRFTMSILIRESLYK